MNKPLALLASAAALSAAAASAATSPPAGGGPVPNAVVTTNSTSAYIFTLQPGVDALALAREFNLQPNCVFRHALNGFAAPVPASQLDALRKDSRIVAVEADGPTELAGYGGCGVLLPFWADNEICPNGLTRMGVCDFPVAHIRHPTDPSYWRGWQTNYLGNPVGVNVDVNVAVLDTGADYGCWLLNLWDVSSFMGDDGSDSDGHGTHVQGTIGAMDLGFAVVGAAPGAKIWSVKVLGPGSGWTNFLAGMEYIVQHANQIEVANASLEGTLGANTTPETAIEQSISNAVSHGIVFVAAAGNDGQDVYGPDGLHGTLDDHEPGACPEALVVSAMCPWLFYYGCNNGCSTNPIDDECFLEKPCDAGTNADRIPAYANFSRSVVTNNPVHSPGKAIDLAAPGNDILSVYPGYQMCIASGTSMAAAHVSGLVALYIAANGRATNAEGVHRIRQALIDNGLPQNQWRSAPNTGDPDGNPEPLAIASEAWVPPVTVSNPMFTPQGFQLSFNAVPGYRHSVQYSSSLDPSSQWTTFATVVGVGKVVTVTVTDTNAPPVSQRFYRVAREVAP